MSVRAELRDRPPEVTRLFLGKGVGESFERGLLLGTGRGRVPGAGRLDRPAERLQRVPGALPEDQNEAEVQSNLSGDLGGGPRPAIGGRRHQARTQSGPEAHSERNFEL